MNETKYREMVLIKTHDPEDYFQRGTSPQYFAVDEKTAENMENVDYTMFQDPKAGAIKTEYLGPIQVKILTEDNEPPKNTVSIRMLPWICGECGRHEVQNLRVYEGGPSFIATCDHCGSEWVS